VSRVIYESPAGGLVVGTYCGPVRRNGGPRTRLQLTLRGAAGAEGLVTLGYTEALLLADAIVKELHTPRMED
jgi:hypothetical protein